jgi:hypothetical protein
LGVSDDQVNSFPRPLKMALGVALALWIQGAPSPAFSQNPTGAQVELWYGIRRVDGLSPAQPVTATQVQPIPEIRTVKMEAKAVADVSSAPPPLPSSLLPVSVPLTLVKEPPLPPVLASREFTPAATAPAECSPAKSSPPPPQVPGNPAPRSPDGAEKGESFFHGFPPTQLFCILIAVITGPVLGALSCWLLIRRFGRRPAESLRVDFSGPPIYGVTAPSASTAAPQPLQPAGGPRQTEGPERRAAVNPAARPATAAEMFDPGPSYAAVRQQREDALRRHEEGILQYLVDQNIELMEQLAVT